MSRRTATKPQAVRDRHRVLLACVFIALFLLLCILPLAHGARLAGVHIPDTLALEQHTLGLRGAGLRTRFFIKLYAGALYTADENTEAARIVAADAPQAITLDILSDRLTRARMIQALTDGFEKSTEGNTAPVSSGIDKLMALLEGGIEPGDHLTLGYLPGRGTEVIKNARSLAVIEGLPFKQALFGIWLGDEPAQASLKQDMLGG